MTEHEHEPAVDELDPEAVDEVVGDALDPDEVDEPAVDDEPADEPVVDDGPSIEAVAKELDREATRHEKALAKALGVAVDDLYACPTCDAMGYTPQPIEADDDPPLDPYLSRCERCDGHGAVRTGARQGAMFEIPCPGCGSTGYVQAPEQAQIGVVPPNGGYAEPPVYLPPMPAAEADPEIARLRSLGYTVLDPIVVPEPVPA